MKLLASFRDNSKMLIPGSAYIFVSFIPWILYWILSGMENREGIAIALVLSLLLLVPQIRKKDLNLMDITSVFYFTVAAAGTFIFGSGLFLEKGEVLGYLTLFLMAAVSLLLKKPYTLQASKKEYPKIYWSDKVFLATNTTITQVWAVIFLANASIFMADLSWAVLAVNVLTVSGMVFSIVFPSKAVARDANKCTWNIESDPAKPKAEDEYDAIIVGSGLGGLTCGALLSKRGYKVLILEQHHKVGGYCSSFTRKGFAFNTGVENISGLWEGGPITYLLKALGLKKEDLFVKNKDEIFLVNGKEIRINGVESLIKQLSELFPEEKENLPVFFDDAKKAYEECYSNAGAYGTPLPGDLILKIYGAKKLMDYPKENPHFYYWMNKTYRQILDEYFRDERLKTILCIGLGYTGTSAEETPGNLALFTRIGYFIHGGYYPKGGADISESLKNYVEGHGSKVLLKHKAGRILVEKGQVAGVFAEGKNFKSNIVVSNANAKTTFSELVGAAGLDKKFLGEINQLKMSPSAFMLNLGLDMDLSGRPGITLLKDGTDEIGLIVNSNADPGMAPKGKASVTLLEIAHYQDFPQRGTKEYVQKKEESTRRMIQLAEKAIPSIGKHIIVQSAATPKTFERYTSMPEGALYSFDQSPETKRPYFKTPVNGLYLTGASTFPGGGIEAVIISGIICANDICNWRVTA